MDVSVLVLVVSGLLGTLVHAHEQCRASPYSINPGAHARFTVIISIRQGVGNKECEDIAESALLTLSTIQWAVQKINTASYIPILDMGFDIYDDCGLDRYSAFSALDTASVRFPQKLRKCYGNDTVHFDLGILGTSRSQTTNNVLNMLSGTNVPVISPFASLPSLDDFPNFLRTTPADNDQVKVIVQLLRDLGWTYIAALHTDDNYGTNGISAILQLAKENGICIDVVQSINVNEDFEETSVLDNFFRNLTAQRNRAANQKLGILYFGQKNAIEQLLIRMNQLKKMGFHWIMSDFVGTSIEVFTDADGVSDGTLTISTASIYMKEVHDFFLEKWNRVMKLRQEQNTAKFDPVEELINEYITSKSSTASVVWRNDYIMPIVDAVYVIATALKNAFHTKCRGYKTVCEGFEDYLLENMLTFMKETRVDYGNMNVTQAPAELVEVGRNVAFSAEGNIKPDASSPLYDVNLLYIDKKEHYFTKIGEYKNRTLTLNSSAVVNHEKLSTCGSVCPRCNSLPSIPYQYFDGDFLLMGIFSIHDPIEDDAFVCGQFRTYTNDVIGAEAFFHAVKQVRNATGIKFGAIAFDDCYSAARGSLIVSQFLSGAHKFKTDSGTYIDPKKVIGVIGPYPSGVTVPLNFLFTRLQIPAISYSSSSPDLDDKINFPYFLRTVPSDVTQADAMVAIIQSMGWETVGIIYVNNNYGSKGKEAFLKAAKANGICVTTPIVLSEADNDQELYIISLQILDKGNGEEVYVYYGTENRIIDLLKEMKTRLTGKADVRNNFVFIGSDTWGASSEILSNYGMVAQGSITFTFDSNPVDNIMFDSYIKTRKPLMLDQNSWFREFWREHFQCDPAGDFDKRIGVPCSDDKQFSTKDIKEFLEDQRIQHIMNAVFAAGYGFENLRTKYCAGQLAGCKIFKEQPAKVLEAIKEVVLQTDSSSEFRVFDSNGNGNIGFNILNLMKNQDNTYRYQKVGSYQQGLSLDKLKISSKTMQVSAKCGSSCACADNKVTTTSTTTEGPCVSVTEASVLRHSDVIIIAIVSSTCLIVLIILLIIIVCFCLLRGKKGSQTASVYYKNQMAVNSNRHGQFVTPGEVKLINPQGSSGDIKDLRGFINQGFSGSEAYLHPETTSSDTVPSPPPPPPQQENIHRNHLVHTPPNSSPSSSHPVSSPVRQKHKRKPNSPSSPSHGGIGSAFPPDLPPREREPSPGAVIPNFKQYQLTNGYPRMGTNISNGSNGSPTTVQNSSNGMDYNPVFGNQVNGASMAGLNIQESPTSPLPETSHLYRRSQFASLKKKQKRLYSEASLNSTNSVEKISRV